MESKPSLLYTDLAAWWPLWSDPADYIEEAEFYGALLQKHCDGEAISLLELGSGGGNNACHMKARFPDTMLVDLSAQMVEVSRRLNPELEHAVGDMRSVRLGRTFDAVFVHDAICYATTEQDVRDTLATAFAHLRPGGVACFAPDYVSENFHPETDHGGHDGEGGRALRYLAWVWDPDPTDTTYVVDYAFLFRQPDGSVTTEHERHVEGLFPTQTWLRAMAEVGFRARTVPFQHSDEPYEQVVFVGVRPAD